MDAWLSEFDFNKTIREYDYTRRVEHDMRKIYDSDNFVMEDAQCIFRYLANEMELLSFGDYLKRYLYRCAELEEPFSQVSDKEYQDIIVTSFDETFTPYSYEKTSRKRGAIVKNWLTSASIKRKYIFLLGFGLQMTEEDVSDFLKRVLKEQDFDITNPEEIIYWYCYKNRLSYSKAQELLVKYKELQSGGYVFDLGVELENIKSEENLFQYLKKLKQEDQCSRLQKKAYKYFLRLLEDVKGKIAEIKNEELAEEGKSKKFTTQDISNGDVENILCCGIPKTKSGNLQKVSASLLGRHFDKKRMSRQRIDQVLTKQTQVERFDLITLLFFLFSQDENIEDPVVRYETFLNAINNILLECGMMKLYSANPYEAFIQMCLISEGPLAVYSDIWEMSYTKE